MRTHGRQRWLVNSLGVLLLGFLLPTPSGAQSVRERARQVLPPDVLMQLEALVEQTAAEGVPAEPLFTKAVEGIAKGARPEQIVPAVTSYAARLATARVALGPEVPVAGLLAGVDAIARGVPIESLGRLDPAERTPMALLVLADLVESGVPADDAVGVVHEAMERRTADEELLAIPSAVQNLIRDGNPAAGAADAVRRAIRDGRPIHDLPSIGGDRRIGAPAPPGSEPVSRDRRRPGGGG